MAPIKVFSIGYVGSASFSSAFTFPNAVKKAFLEVPTFSSGSDLYLNGSTDGSTYRRIMQDLPLSSSVQVNTYQIGSSATNSFIPIPLAAPYMKIEPTTAPAGSCTFKVICHF